MPGGDRTGPMGYGPMTGRAAGFCAGYVTPGYVSPEPGRGFGMGLGRGRGGRRGFGAPRGMAYGAAPQAVPYDAGPTAAQFAGQPTPEQEAATLKQQAENLEAALDGLRDRIAALEHRDPAGK